MKLTTRQAINAIAGINALRNKLMDYQTSREVFAWSMFLRTELKNAEAFEKTLIERYGGKKQNDGKIHFETEEKAAGFAAEMEAMKNTEIETELYPIDMSKIGNGETVFMQGTIWEVLEPIIKAEETA